MLEHHARNHRRAIVDVHVLRACASCVFPSFGWDAGSSFGTLVDVGGGRTFVVVVVSVVLAASAFAQAVVPSSGRLEVDGRSAVHRRVSRAVRDTEGRLAGCLPLETRAWLLEGERVARVAGRLPDPREVVPPVVTWNVPFHEASAPCETLARRERRPRLGACVWTWPITERRAGAALTLEAYDAETFRYAREVCDAREGVWSDRAFEGRGRGAGAGEGTEEGEGARVVCRDGTLSPTCRCGRSLRGCCSHHGGVAGCE